MEVKLLLGVLDRLDGDPDLEDSVDDEQMLGGSLRPLASSALGTVSSSPALAPHTAIQPM